jgi:glycosyltransferase 2 family protein
MTAAPEAKPPNTEPEPNRRFRLSTAGRFFAGYAWLIVKNVVGWAFILISPALGFTLPGPGGIPLFLIGFALVTFPGKRKLTARVLRGRPMDLEQPRFGAIEVAAAIIIPLILVWPGTVWLLRHIMNLRALQKAWYVATALVAVSITWIIVRFALRGINLLIRVMPRFRRKIRPWLRRNGILLLPPRYRRRPILEGALRDDDRVNDQILQIHDRHRLRARSAWRNAWPWIRRGIGLAVTCWIFAIMISPLRKLWPQVKDQIHSINWGRFVIASVMFSIFLFLFRAISWRRVLKGFGFKLPVWAAVRVWSTSEMARYLPGAIMQLVGRAYLVRPYGVNSVISSTSQILELCIFLFANVLVAGSCLLWYAAKLAGAEDHKAYHALIVAICLMPTLAALLHPKIFYTLTNRILGWLNRPPIVQRLRGWKLVKLLGYVILGLLWQSMAVFLIAQPILHLKIDWWWMVAAAYCLAWAAGFLAFWAPGGLGVRELIFATVMLVVMEPRLRPPELSDPAMFKATVCLLAFLLRLWTLAGEILLWGISLLADYRGATNQPNAPGRIPSN